MVYGQSNICKRHLGNKRLQVILGMYAAWYSNTTRHNSGERFLKFKNNDGLWEAISNVATHKNVSQVLQKRQHHGRDININKSYTSKYHNDTST